MAMIARQSGFTLVEVLVALVLMAVVSLVSWRGLESVVGIRTHIDRDAGRNADIERVLGQLERDLLMRAPDYVLEGGAAAAKGRPDRLPASVHVQPLSDDADAIEVVRAAELQDGGWQRIRWWMEAGTLRRARGQSGDVFPLAQTAPGATVLEDVTAFEVRLYTPGQGWTAAGTSPDAAVASGLEFIIALTATAGEAPRYRRVVALP